MEMALKAGDPAAAQIVAAECVVDAETKDHQNWELIGKAGEKLKGEEGAALREAYEEVEDEEDEHLYHTAGWTRELWIESLGMPAAAAAARGGEGREDGHRRGAGQAGQEPGPEEGGANLAGPLGTSGGRRHTRHEVPLLTITSASGSAA